MVPDGLSYKVRKACLLQLGTGSPHPFGSSAQGLFSFFFDQPKPDPCFDQSVPKREDNTCSENTLICKSPGK